MALTLTDVRSRVETDFDDETLQRILDAAGEELARHAGNPTSEVESLNASGSPYLQLSRRHASVTTITERRTPLSDLVTLETDDWREVGDYQLLRLATGTNPSSTWGCEVVVTYAPEIDVEQRDRVLLDLVQIDVEFRAFSSESVGGWSGDQGDYSDRRRAVLGQIREGRSLVA